MVKQQTTFNNPSEALGKTIRIKVNFFKGKVTVFRGDSNYKDMLLGTEELTIGITENLLTYDTFTWSGYYVNQQLLSKFVASMKFDQYPEYYSIGVSIV